VRIQFLTDHKLGSVLAGALWLARMGLFLYRHTDFFMKIKEAGFDRRFWRVTHTNPIGGWEFVLAVLGTLAFGCVIAGQART
jgi:hypothetical protein